jgi:chemotaxis protein methyltransferase CheR
LYRKRHGAKAVADASLPESGRIAPSQVPAAKRETVEIKQQPEFVSHEKELRALANRGDWAAAARCCERMLELDDLNPRTYFYYALISDHLNDAKRATELLRKAVYLDRGFVLAHYHFGLALKRENDAQQAARHFRVVLELLDHIPEEQTLPEDRDISVVELKALTKLQLEVLTAT